MEYIENKEKFYKSEYATQIADGWINGIPFFVEKEGIYDCFLFYTVNRKSLTFSLVKMLVEIGALESDMNLVEDLDSLNIKRDFPFEPISISDIEEYLSTLEEIEKAYVELRDNYLLTNTLNQEIQKRYLSLVCKIIPKEIIKNVYFSISPTLFTGIE